MSIEIRHERRQSRRLARALQVAFHIGEGDDLVAVVGRGDEHDNLAALVNWVEQHLADPDPSLAEAALPHLTDQLERDLLRWQEGPAWI